MARIGIVVVTFRSATTIEACLSSLRGATAARCEIVVVDNASNDDSALRAESAGADIVLRNKTNVGYGRANNQGVAALSADTQLVVFANPDTVWPGGSLDELAATFADPAAGLASPLLVGTDGAPQAMVEDDLSLRRALMGMTRLAKPVRPRVPFVKGDAVIDVASLHTAAAMVPMPLVRAIGGFDERFFLFAEDADLCRRIRNSGKRVVVAPAVRVTHVGGASFDAAHTSDETAALRTRALATYLDKYEGPVARRTFGAVGAVVYGLGRHRGQAREALRAARR
ncbi:MAG: hypothetical protein QOJ00_3007 [Actinomycetota bacterium]